MEAEKANFTIAGMCRALEVKRGGFYAWRVRLASAHCFRDRRRLRKIRVSYYESRRTYVSPRIHRALVAQGECVSRKRVARLMREEGLKSRRSRRFRVTTDSRHSQPVARNELARRFEPGSVERWWVADVTFIGTMEGWLYLATLLDLTTRQILGWSMSERNDTALVSATLEMAVGRTDVTPHGHHSDQGSNYASDAYQRRLAELGIRCSMSRRANCWDNAVAESFFSTLKTEWLDHHRFPSRQAARSAAFDFIEVFYNRRRRHSSLGYLSPEEYARRLKSA